MTTACYQISNQHIGQTIAQKSLVRMTIDILWAMEEQLITMMVILDLSAAFDMVDHNILLRIWENQVGVTGTASNGLTATSDQDHSRYG